MSELSEHFSNPLILWYFDNKRALPWRETTDPYNIWLSEIMLQQTRVAQGLPYYLKFTSAFPTVFDLAQATEQQVLKLWQGLGYYSRARNLHTTARYVAEQLNGKFPESYKGLLELKGVGDYTASAIASICYNAPAAVVDGNVYRVLSRVFGIDTPINSTAGIKAFKELAQQLLDSSQPGTFNQAIMEFGARFCVPQNPDCGSCIFASRCLAFRNNMVDQLPVKLKKQKIKKQHYHYIVPMDQKANTVLKKRSQKGIWQELYEFPLVASDRPISLEVLRESQAVYELAENVNSAQLTPYNKEPILHKLSHRHIYATFYILPVDQLKENAVQAKKIRGYPVPVLLERFIEDFGF